MKQLVAARAVITIWTPNSIQSDWVRAEAGRAKADGKLIPVKASELTYADIPLPFGEMHTENVTSTELIRAAIVAQLSKPALPQAPFWQITRMFEYQALTWVGIVGTAITVFANLQGVLNLADWASELVNHWHEWNHIIWGWVFNWVGIKLPKVLVPVLSFSLFTTMLIAGVNLAERGVTPLHDLIGRTAGLRFSRGVSLYMLVSLAVFGILIGGGYSSLLRIPVVVTAIIAWIGGFPTGFLLYVIKERRSLVFVNSVLFFVMATCLLWVPLLTVSEDAKDPVAGLTFIFAIAFMFPIFWMAVILFSPVQQLTRRLGFVVIGVLTLVVLNEISQLNLHQYVRPPRVSENFGPLRG
jgi:hypothetical protein